MNNLDEFWDFLGAWLPDADLQGVDDDEQVVRNFIDTDNPRVIKAVLAGLHEVLATTPLPVQRISDEANRHFASEADCRDWLDGLSNVFAEHAAE